MDITWIEWIHYSMDTMDTWDISFQFKFSFVSIQSKLCFLYSRNLVGRRVRKVVPITDTHTHTRTHWDHIGYVKLGKFQKITWNQMERSTMLSSWENPLHFDWASYSSSQTLSLPEGNPNIHMIIPWLSQY